MKEYRKIPSLKFMYEISKEGIIRNIKSKKVLQHFDGWNYKVVRVRINDKSTCRFLHRLIAECWIPIPQRYIDMGYTMEDLVVNHKDFNKHNNSIDNLEWCTQEENIQYSYYNDSSFREKVLAPLKKYDFEKRKPIHIQELDLDFDNPTDATKYLISNNLVHTSGSSRTVYRHIMKAASGERKSAYGYHFFYI